MASRRSPSRLLIPRSELSEQDALRLDAAVAVAARERAALEESEIMAQADDKAMGLDTIIRLLALIARRLA